MSRRDAAGSASSSCRPPRLLELGIRGMSPARRGVWKRCVGAGGTGCGRLDVMNRLGRAMADPTRSRILMTLLEGPSYPAVLARDLGRV